MKRLCILALSLVLLLTLAACGEKTPAETQSPVESGAVSFTADTVFEEGAAVTVEAVTSGDSFEKAKTAITPIGDQFTVYDFNATKDGQKVQPNGKLKVTFRIPEEYGENVGIYYIPESGEAEKIPTTVDKEAGTAVAELEHFSLYVLVAIRVIDPPLPSKTTTAPKATTAKATAKATTVAPTKAPTTVKKTAAPTTAKTSAVSTVNPAGYKDNHYYVADLQEVTGGLVRSRLLFTGEYCVVMRYGYSAVKEDEESTPFEYNGKTYYGVGEGQSPCSFELTDTEIRVKDQNEGTVRIKTVLQSDGNMRVIFSDVEYFFVGQILKPQAE